MSRLIRQSDMSQLLDEWAVRGDLPPTHQLDGLRALRYRLAEHFEPDALFVLEAEIKRIEELRKKK
ncbi:MAG: hypothetical protein AAB575_01640 [Patescibacteria group bacterium]